MTLTDTLEYQRLQDQLRRTRKELLEEGTSEERRQQLRERRERLLDTREELENR